MAGNPILGFLETTNTPTGARGEVSKNLRLLGIVMLAGVAVSLLGTVLSISMGSAYQSTAVALATTTAISAGLFSLAVTCAVLFWITWTITAWNQDRPNGGTHVLVIGILATVFGGLGVLGGLTGGMLAGAGLLSAGNTVLFTITAALSLLLSTAECYTGVMTLVHRSRSTSGTTTATTN